MKKWIDSINYAIEGVLHAAKTQKHVKLHFIATGILLFVCFILGVKKLEFILISIISSIVEAMVDLLSPQIQERARIVKDLSAGAVLIAAGIAAIIGYIILIPYVRNIIARGGLPTVTHNSTSISVIALIIVLILVIVIKSFFGKGHPLRGGMPSGHSAIAFSIWASVTCTSGSRLVSVLTFLIALVLAQSRVLLKIHTYFEVIAGAILGAVTTFTLYHIFLKP
jgi:diacylglycerol kinase (ATP)